MKLNDRVKEFNVELDRLKKIIPELRCSEMMTCRSQLHILMGYTDDGLNDTFAVEWTTDSPKILASRLLDSYTLMLNRLYKNYEALKEIVNEQR